MSSLWLDLRYALRMMVRSPGLTTVLLITLAIGIGATTTIFSILDSMLLRPLPYDRPEQLVRIYTDLTGKPVYRGVPLARPECSPAALCCAPPPGGGGGAGGCGPPGGGAPGGGGRAAGGSH